MNRLVENVTERVSAFVHGNQFTISLLKVAHRKKEIGNKEVQITVTVPICHREVAATFTIGSDVLKRVFCARLLVELSVKTPSVELNSIRILTQAQPGEMKPQCTHRVRGKLELQSHLTRANFKLSKVPVVPQKVVAKFSTDRKPIGGLFAGLQGIQ